MNTDGIWNREGRHKPSLSVYSGGKLQRLLVGLNHLLDHLAADRTGLAGGQIAVVAFLQVHADLP